MMTPDIQDASTITSWVNNMILSLRNNIIIIKFWFSLATVSTWLIMRTVVLILCPYIQLILVELIIFGDIDNLVTFNR